MEHTLQQYQERFGVSPLDREFAVKLDENDDMKEFRNEFLFPAAPEGKRCIYLCGNSLGLQPANLKREVNNYLDKWAREGVEGHFTGISNNNQFAALKFR